MSAFPKTFPYRDPRLLMLACGQLCLLTVPGVCNGNPATTVAAHSNQRIHGKGAARKADDCFSVWACSACHVWLDQGLASAEEKTAAFELGMRRQIDAWTEIANDSSRYEPSVRAARLALEHLGKA